MKKIISLLLALSLAVLSMFALGSCANPNPEDTLVCGVTEIPGLNERDDNGEWTIGFETEFAMAVAEKLGMKIKFVEIDWGQKYNEVNSGAIDAIWNGFTANSADNGVARNELVDFSYGYMLNQQCVVVKADNLAQYTDEASLAGKVATCEGGSAGEAYAETVTDEEILDVTAQMDTFREVISGSADFAVVDIVLANNVVGQGDFEDLAIVESIQLESEVYAVGFKTGSELTAKVNAAIEELFEEGAMATLAEKYGYTNVVELIKEIDF